MDHNLLKFIVQAFKQLCQHKECGVGAKAEKMGQNNFSVRKCQFMLA